MPTEADFSQFNTVGTNTPGGSVFGAPLASAATIAPTHKVHHVTGTTAIDTITKPWAGFVGPLYLITDAACSFTTAGNIKKAQTCVAGYVYMLLYDNVEAKWYQQALA